jgi:kinesin family protein C1
VQSALDGYRVCIFAYGQTGSGKTYTMSAPQRQDIPGELDVHSDARGVIPRAVDMIFQEVRRLKERGWTHQVEVSFVEIYNEALRDLLCVGGSEQKRLDIKHIEGGDGGKVAQVTNLKVVQVMMVKMMMMVMMMMMMMPVYHVTMARIFVAQVTCAEEVTDLLVAASRMRATASTRSNEQSSRSHSVFVMHVRGWHEATGEVCDGQLNLIDLAGSERMEKGSRAEQQEGRIKETQAINKSLSSLCDVISALANKEQHVPFRNSKLTYLLQPSLGGDSKCLMFVNVSPARIHFHETLCSLRFASKVSSVQLRK